MVESTEDNKLIKSVNDETLQETIASGVTLVDFFAEWCGPCRMLGPILQEIAEKMGDKVTVAKLDVDTSQKTTSTFQVTSVPTMILFKDGVEVDRIDGLRDAEFLEEMINKAQS